MNKQSQRAMAVFVFGGIGFYCALQNLGAVVLGVGAVISLLSPLLLGGAIAFVLSVPMGFLERKLFSRPRKWVRPASLILTLVLLFGVLFVASVVIVPNLKEAVSVLPDQISGAFSNVSTYLTQLAQSMPELEIILTQLNLDWNAISQQALSLAKNIGNSALTSGGLILGGVVSGVSNFVLGLIFSFYILLQKEKLSRQGKMLLFALLPKGVAEKTVDILKLSHGIFASFLSGQCLEAVILGGMFVVAMAVFQMPYALLVGVLVALTALIPLVGAFIGCAVGVFLIALTNPMQALVFLVLFLVLQQVEGNFIYPHVVGSSVGLPSIWVLVAVFLGGSFMGVLGMLLFIPLFSVGYALLRSFVHQRLEERDITVT